jgi:soluble lytic murein transglycosylase-like protein
MDDSPLIAIAKQCARNAILDPALVCAVCEQESGWNPWAMRFEPMFLRHYIKPVVPEAPTTEQMARATSWGLMQIMGETARELGFSSKYLAELGDPATGLLWGCKKLRGCLDARGDERLALLMWNGGGNPAYPDQVIARMKTYW